MPISLSNFPATYQSLDDVLLYSDTFERHLSSLREVFSRIKAAGLKLNPSKCHLARNHVVFLGHVISQQGL